MGQVDGSLTLGLALDVDFGNSSKQAYVMIQMRMSV